MMFNGPFCGNLGYRNAARNIDNGGLIYDFPREGKILSGQFLCYFGSRICGSEAFASMGQWIMVSRD